ncbi:beta-ketoacyl synthase N-terminal-like domain-containing protein [Streptomyces sp. DH10]|uniref:beta-ketoacyl synthase N-terminal-like domain-containing protein n=1 Tax=Streptomyces sp. DH10 TaxID=3040121 RepID=UPI002442E72D|nr:beta-ketoacyl synthase N-terminal-like domain-containing protein [Streptomyces sp. DH10]MDG9712177.1 beta-ketoacyl synthase N-terminal-like domain-containing protein [Streptomyces sp. DH10]
MSTDIPDAIVVTGIGAVLPTGRGPEALWTAWREARPALSPYRDPYVRSRRITHFGHVPDELQKQGRDSVPHKLRKFGTPFTFNAVLAVQDAQRQAGKSWEAIPEERRGLYVAQDDSTDLSAAAFTKALDKARTDASAQVGADLQRVVAEAFGNAATFNPFTVIRALNNNTLALVSIAERFRGDCAAFVQDAGAALSALQRAQFSLRNGHCDTAVVVGAGSYNEALKLAGLYRAGQLSAGGHGRDSLRSFAPDRDGTVVGEGAVALVLERAEDAVARGARPLVEVVGTRLRPALDGGVGPADLAESARTLLAAHGMTPDMLGAVLADGKGTVHHDTAEIELLRTLLKDSRVPVSSVRPIVGTLGAAGPLAELALAPDLFAAGELPPIAHLSTSPDEGTDFVTGSARKRRIDSVLSLHSTFNGFAGALLAKRPHTI